MTETFQFTLKKTDAGARLGQISMPRGEIRTPAFMPVGTVGTVKAMYLDQVRDTGADIILGNTYHLMLRPRTTRSALENCSFWEIFPQLQAAACEAVNPRKSDAKTAAAA